MSTILEALDAMYEVKGEAEANAHYRNIKDKIASGHDSSDRNTVRGLNSQKDKGYSTGMNYMTNGNYNSTMRNANDYRNRARQASDINRNIKDQGLENRNLRYVHGKSERGTNRYIDKAKTECTETIDTLDGIL